MELMDLAKALVETEDKMERMALIEANQELLSAPAQSADGVEDWEGKYRELEKKYIDTFFGGTSGDGDGNTGDGDGDGADTKDPESERAESIQIDDLFKKEDK